MSVGIVNPTPELTPPGPHNRHHYIRAEIELGWPRTRQVLDCASPLALLEGVEVINTVESGRGLPHSKTLPPHPDSGEDSWPRFTSKAKHHRP